MQQIKIFTLELDESMWGHQKLKHIEGYEKTVNDFLAEHQNSSAQSFVHPAITNTQYAITRFTTVVTYEKE